MILNALSHMLVCISLQIHLHLYIVFLFGSLMESFGDFGSKLALLANHTNDIRFAAAIPGDSAFEVVATTGIYNFLNYYNFAIVIRLLLTWFPNPPQALVGPLSTICDPYLNIFRGIIPPLGQLDLSPIISLGLLNFLTSATAALPCEMSKKGVDVAEEGIEASMALEAEKEEGSKVSGHNQRTAVYAA